MVAPTSLMREVKAGPDAARPESHRILEVAGSLRLSTGAEPHKTASNQGGTRRRRERESAPCDYNARAQARLPSKTAASWCTVLAPRSRKAEA